MSLRSVIGQDKAVRILIGTLSTERVPTSMLLSGDSGIGKRLTALNYAKALNCLSPIESDACDNCLSCRKIDGAMHPDVVTLLPENNEIKIEAIRRVEEILSLRPYEGKRKVLITDDADSMNISAANAFLKTLEEPPENTVILLVSSNPDRLPDTIRSRCMHVLFRPLSGDAFSQVLALKSDGKSPGPFAALAMGRPGISITRDFAKEKKWFMDILENMSNGDTRCAWNDKNDIRLWLDLSLVMLRDMAVHSVTGNDSALLCEGKRPGVDLLQVLDTAVKLQRLLSLVELNLNKSITWNYVSGIIQKTLKPASS